MEQLGNILNKYQAEITNYIFLQSYILNYTDDKSHSKTKCRHMTGQQNVTVNFLALFFIIWFVYVFPMSYNSKRSHVLGYELTHKAWHSLGPVTWL